MSTLVELIQDATGWCAVWHDYTPQGTQARITALTTQQLETYRTWPGVKVTRLQKRDVSEAPITF